MDTSNATYDLVKSAVDKQAAAFDVWKVAQQKKLDDVANENASLKERLECLESKRHSPGRGGAPSLEASGVKRFFTNTGAIYELPSTVKMADVLPSADGSRQLLSARSAATRKPSTSRCSESKL